MKLVWRVSDNESCGMLLPWYYGYVREFELTREFAVIPLNLVLAWAHWMHRGIQYRFTPRAQRWTNNRAALARAFDRGLECGRTQERAMYHSRMRAEANRMIEAFVRHSRIAGLR